MLLFFFRLCSFSNIWSFLFVEHWLLDGFTVFFSVHRTAPIIIFTNYLMKFNTSTVWWWYCIVSYRLVLYLLYLSCKKMYCIRFWTRFLEFAFHLNVKKKQQTNTKHKRTIFFLFFRSTLSSVPFETNLNYGHTLTELEYAHFIRAHSLITKPKKMVFWWTFRPFFLSFSFFFSL